jgi:hypothetical protein
VALAFEDGSWERGDIQRRERMNAAEHLVGNNGERPQIPTAAEGAGPQLLGRHVAQSSDRNTGEGVRGFVGDARKKFGDAEIGYLYDFGGAGANQENIFGL